MRQCVLMKLVKLDTRQFYCLVISPVHTLFIPYKHLTFYLFIWGVLALGGCTRFFLAVLRGWYSLVAVHRLLSAAPSRCTGPGRGGFSGGGYRTLERRPVVVVHGLSSPGHVGSSWTRDQTCVSYIGRGILYH